MSGERAVTVDTPVSRADIERAEHTIRRYVRETPVMEVDRSVLGTPGSVTLKLELLQHAGSFKPRGAFNRVLSADVPSAGLVTASGGNHGIAVSHVASVLGLAAEVFVPSTSPATKQERIAANGAKLVLAGDIYDDAQAAADERARETGALLVHPYDHPHVVAGQGTVGAELARQAPNLDTVLVAVGGGGLIAGVASWFRGDVKVVSVEPETIPAMASALRDGTPVEVPVSGLAADSLGAKRIGAVPWACASPFVHEAVLVSDDDIRAAQRALWRQFHLVVEPGGAAAAAALLSGAYRPADGERVCAIVCGTNTDPELVMG
jgi:threonine dehydratase